MCDFLFVLERGIVFVISATSKVADAAFSLMQDTIQFVLERYGSRHVKYHVIVTGEGTSSSGRVRFNSNSPDLEALVKNVKDLRREKKANPALHKDLQKAVSAFQSNGKSPPTKKVSKYLPDVLSAFFNTLNLTKLNLFEQSLPCRFRFSEIRNRTATIITTKNDSKQIQPI